MGDSESLVKSGIGNSVKGCVFDVACLCECLTNKKNRLFKKLKRIAKGLSIYYIFASLLDVYLFTPYLLLHIFPGCFTCNGFVFFFSCSWA